MTLYFKQKMSNAVHNHGRHDGFRADHALAFARLESPTLRRFWFLVTWICSWSPGITGSESGLIYGQKVNQLAFQRLAAE